MYDDIYSINLTVLYKHINTNSNYLLNRGFNGNASLI